MNIKKEGDELVVRIPLTQKGTYTYDEDKVWEQDNLVGIIAGNECYISQLIYLDYKDDLQEGCPIFYVDDKEELFEICNKYNIQIWEHPVCFHCKKVIYGSHGWSSEGVYCGYCKEK